MSGTHKTLLRNAIMVMSMIEEVDGVTLTNAERVAFVIFACYMCSSPYPLLHTDLVDLLYNFELDWCTSFTCSVRSSGGSRAC